MEFSFIMFKLKHNNGNLVQIHKCNPIINHLFMHTPFAKSSVSNATTFKNIIDVEIVFWSCDAWAKIKVIF